MTNYLHGVRSTAIGESDRLLTAVVIVALVYLVAGCGNGGGNSGDGGSPVPLEESRDFRAVAGVSMGAYGAMNLGTKHPDIFGTIASLGGPIDMSQLLADSVRDNLEVKPQTEIPRAVGDDFTFDHLPPYPDRDTRILMLQDLTIAFGNPFLHHPDPSRQYLARDAEPAENLMDDAFGAFVPPASQRGFLDGGDTDADGLRQGTEMPLAPTEVLLLATGSLPTIVSGVEGVRLGERLLADLNDDGIFDVGEGIVVNLSESFDDSNGNLLFEPELGEVFEDLGLDGVSGTDDFGEENGVFDYDPDRANWLAEDPLTRVTTRSADEIARQRIYMDVGTEDEFAFERHYANFAAVLRAKGLTVQIDEGFSANCALLEQPDAQFQLVRYAAGHIGFASVDSDDLFAGNVCGSATVWQRIISMIAFLNESFPDGFFGPGDDFDVIDINIDDPEIDVEGLNVRGELVDVQLLSPVLMPSGNGTAGMRSVLVYLPPAFTRSNASFPVVYFLGGYGQTPQDFRRVGLLLDALILTGQLQNMYFVFLPGSGGRVGSFYVNQIIPEQQVPDVPEPTSGRYEDSILEDLIPQIENEVLDGRVRRQTQM